MSFLSLEGKNYLVTGVANKRSVATFTAKALLNEGANVILTVQNENNFSEAKKLFPHSLILYCDVTQTEKIKNLAKDLELREIKLSGILHSIAFARYELSADGKIPRFHETSPESFLEATRISAFSLTELTRYLLPSLLPEASVVTVSISDTRATSYGMMGPIKAMLNSTVDYLAASLAPHHIRVNAICAGPLKTSASAGIPDYLDNYIFAEQLTLRKKALLTEEVAKGILFLLSDASSGFNASHLVIDAGMSVNHFDPEIVKMSAQVLLNKN